VAEARSFISANPTDSPRVARDTAAVDPATDDEQIDDIAVGFYHAHALPCVKTNESYFHAISQ
jgi:hypothetical protein